VLIFLSTNSTNAFSISTFYVLESVIKYGEMYPLSHFIPSTYSTSVSRVFPSLTVIVPLAPSLSKIVAIKPPIFESPLAEIVATC